MQNTETLPDIWTCAQLGDTAGIKKNVALGADVNKQGLSHTSSGTYGITEQWGTGSEHYFKLTDSTVAVAPPLHFACCGGKLETVELLVELGADPTIRAEGCGAIPQEICYRNGHFQCEDLVDPAAATQRRSALDQKMDLPPPPVIAPPDAYTPGLVTSTDMIDIPNHSLVVYASLGPNKHKIVIPPDITYPEMLQMLEMKFKQRLMLSFTKPVTNANKLIHQIQRAHRNLPQLPNATERVVPLDDVTLPSFLSLPPERLKLQARLLYPGLDISVSPSTKTTGTTTKSFSSQKERLKTLEADIGITTNIKTKTVSKEEENTIINRLYGYNLQKLLSKKRQEEEEVQQRLKRLRYQGGTGTGKSTKPLQPHEKEIVSNLYEKAMERKQLLETRLKEQFIEHPSLQPKTTTMTEDETDECVTRLYKVGVERKRDVLKETETKIYGVPVKPMKLSAAQEKETVLRLYDTSLQQRKEKMQKADEQFSWKPVQLPKLSPEAMDATLARLAAPVGK
eukprot:TRINITY_DN62608_c0_g1_i1.p1 TRINITY_DN62608_c0_g1~~TRINITY_DN62608_c0_g1_i1.p1  ORF type:complete len:510 (+),score=33.33 TRINITY_DN62608_c0_g1_i1:84-1613(+)